MLRGSILGLLAIFGIVLLGGIRGENFNPNPIFLKFMSSSKGPFSQLTQNDLEELIQMVKHENLYTITKAKPMEIRRFFDEHDKNTDTLALFGRLSNFLKQRGYSGFCPERNVTCSKETNYRSYDGLCNNLNSPLWGSFLDKFNRFLEPKYEDGKHVPRGAIYSKEEGYKSRLPNPRKISADLHEDEEHTSTDLTHFYMQFGQFLSHDIAKSTKDDLDCCNEEIAKDPRCFNIDIHEDEFFHGDFNRSCLEFTRSDSTCDSEGQREQFNSVTSYLDCSTIYGSCREANLMLRNGMTDGTLRTHSSLPHFLPTRKDLGSHLYKSEANEDFIAGDQRCQTQSTLLAMHILWFREHNRIARTLGPMLKQQHIQHLQVKEQDEIIFQETRRLVIAEFTNIIYSEYLPILLPNDCDGITLQLNSNYDPNMNASILNEFVSAAYRFGHSLVQGVFEGLDQAWRLGSFFGDAQFATSFEGNGVEKELIGAIHQPCQEADRFISKELTRKLYLNKEMLNKTDNWRGMGSDLAALNIQRGRDHGIPDYNSVRDKCGLSRIDHSYFHSSNVPEQFDEDTWNKLKSIYGSVEDIDLFSGGLSEKKRGGKRVGETFHCLICEQFKRLKDGDRFFFTHAEGSEGKGLHIELQSMILRRKLSDIICENSIGLDKLKRNVFTNIGKGNPEVHCQDDSRHKIDFELVAKHFKREDIRYPNVKIYFP